MSCRGGSACHCQPADVYLVPNMPCAACGGRETDAPCPECDGEGTAIVRGCPWKAVDTTAWRMIDAARILDRGGGWPNSTSGWTNELACVVQAVRLVWSLLPQRKHDVQES